MTKTNNNNRKFVSSKKETEDMPTMSFGRFDNSSIQFTFEKINGKNYREYAQSIKLVIDGKGRVGYPKGKTKEPSPTNLVSLQK